MSGKTAVFFCNCSGNISDKIDSEKVAKGVKAAFFTTIGLACSEDGQNEMAEYIRRNGVERVVVSACSPRDHEATFQTVLRNVGINPYYLQMVNSREQIAWVTADSEQAVQKAIVMINAAISRVNLHDPLMGRQVEMSPDVLIVGAGPTGLKAAMHLAEAGRKVTIVERSPFIGGKPVQYEELYPNMACGPCKLEPMMADILHGPHAENIDLLTMAEVTDVVGFYGNFTVTITQKARYADPHACIGCQECLAPCPVEADNPYTCNLSKRKAISFPFAGALPNAPFIDMGLCLRAKGDACELCRAACPIENVIRFDDADKTAQKKVGAVLLATGFDLYDCGSLPNLGYGKVPDVVTSFEFERIFSSNGPYGGEVKCSNGSAPRSLAIIHCVGSLDEQHKPYCSEVCCKYALKFNHMASDKLESVEQITHLYKELSLSGKVEAKLLRHAQHNNKTTMLRYGNIGELSITAKDNQNIITHTVPGGATTRIQADMVVLCPAMVGSVGSAALAEKMGIAVDLHGFYDELDDRLDAAQSKVKGIYVAGAAEAPMDIQASTSQAVAAVGYILSGLVVGRKLDVSPVVAVIDENRCSGCRVCVSICPYKAISYDDEKKVSRVNDVLCQGCGTCVAACPSGARTLRGNHFTDAEIMAEIREVLR